MEVSTAQIRSFIEHLERAPSRDGMVVLNKETVLDVFRFALEMAERPEGPRLSYDLPQPFVVARGEGKVLLGGLGALGVGQMWVDEEDRHRQYEGYVSAQIVTPPE